MWLILAGLAKLLSLLTRETSAGRLDIAVVVLDRGEVTYVRAQDALRT